MPGMMLTAIDASTGSVLDLTLMDERHRDAVHGARTARRNGYDVVCRGCGQPVYFVRNHHHTEFWRHGHDGARTCLLSEFRSNESSEHLEAKLGVVTALRGLSWEARPEETFGTDCRVDVYATHPKPADHQTPFAWEIQLSRQTHGDFTERTRRIRDAAGCTVSWLTPFDAELDGHQGIVTDDRCRMVVGRLHAEPDEFSPRLEPMELRQFVKAVARRSRTLLWSASGHGGRFIAYPVTWAKPGTPAPIRTAASAGGRPVDGDWDRTCDRAVVELALGDATHPLFDRPLHSTSAAGWDDEQWARYALMAQARAHAGLPLDAQDREALRRHPIDGHR